jgi:hypothetical protein
MIRRFATACAAIALAAVPAAAQPEPSGPHPRILHADVKAAWKKLASSRDNPIARAMRRCDEVGSSTGRFETDNYMGFEWGGYLQACLIGWTATGKDAHAKTAMKYFVAILDDLKRVGDGAGGDSSVHRDSGYAMRMIGPMAALGYDWLHDHPLMTDAIRKRARQRFKAWTDWYLKDGYRARGPGNNYQAGYLIGATFMAIAQGGEAGADGARLWKHVVDDLWNTDMKRVLAKGGYLDGGDWGEGWQYGPLSIVEYAVAARAMTDVGVEVPRIREWLDGVVYRHVHALNPSDRVFVGGDTGDEQPYLAPATMTLAAVLIGDASPDAKAWAAGELVRLRLEGDDAFAWYAAVAAAGVPKPVDVPRDKWPTWYVARGTSTLYARTRWGKSGVWTAMQCTATLDLDHHHANAGNVVLSRGGDDLIVDPSPYGTLSTLTSNAPTVESAHLPPDYKPGQAWWSKKTRFLWAHQTTRGVVATRCDYADQFAFQERPSDVPAAMRDMVLVPWDDGGDATLVVIDTAKSGDNARGLHLRFRSLGALKLSGDVATATIGDTELSIRKLRSSSGTPVVARSTKKDCFGEGTKRGNCDAARFPVTDVRLVVDGPAMSAIHVIDATARGKAPKASLVGDAVWLDRGDRGAAIVAGETKPYTVPAKPSLHVIPSAASATGAKSGSDCTITPTAGKSVLVISVDDACTVTADPILTGGPTLVGDDGSTGTGTGNGDGTGNGTGNGTGGSGHGDPTGPRSGCCGAQASPDSSLALTVLVLAFLVRRRP